MRLVLGMLKVDHLPIQLYIQKRVFNNIFVDVQKDGDDGDWNTVGTKSKAKIHKNKWYC